MPAHETSADYMIVFDGGTSGGNPGLGYGSYAIFDARGTQRVLRHLEFGASATNNEAEYNTLLAALADLRERLKQQVAQTVIVIRGDSRLVIAQVTGEWEARDERMTTLRDAARASLRPFKRYRLVWQARAETVKILGH